MFLEICASWQQGLQKNSRRERLPSIQSIPLYQNGTMILLSRATKAQRLVLRLAGFISHYFIWQPSVQTQVQAVVRSRTVLWRSCSALAELVCKENCICGIDNTIYHLTAILRLPLLDNLIWIPNEYNLQKSISWLKIITCACSSYPSNYEMWSMDSDRCISRNPLCLIAWD